MELQPLNEGRAAVGTAQSAQGQRECGVDDEVASLQAELARKRQDVAALVSRVDTLEKQASATEAQRKGTVAISRAEVRMFQQMKHSRNPVLGAARTGRSTEYKLATREYQKACLSSTSPLTSTFFFHPAHPHRDTPTFVATGSLCE
jgi:hypothetical protein